jgi:hypothetical protein
MKRPYARLATRRPKILCLSAPSLAMAPAYGRGIHVIGVVVGGRPHWRVLPRAVGTHSRGKCHLCGPYHDPRQAGRPVERTTGQRRVSRSSGPRGDLSAGGPTTIIDLGHHAGAGLLPLTAVLTVTSSTVAHSNTIRRTPLPTSCGPIKDLPASVNRRVTRTSRDLSPGRLQAVERRADVRSLENY